jgi:hypothetical protein
MAASVPAASLRGAVGAEPSDGLWTASALRARNVSAVLGQCRPELSARADAELGEHLPQMPFDGPRADIQAGSDFRVRKTLTGEPRDLFLLRRELIVRLNAAPADPSPVAANSRRVRSANAPSRSRRTSHEPYEAADAPDASASAAEPLAEEEMRPG